MSASSIHDSASSWLNSMNWFSIFMAFSSRSLLRKRETNLLVLCRSLASFSTSSCKISIDFSASP